MGGSDSAQRRRRSEVLTTIALPSLKMTLSMQVVNILIVRMDPLWSTQTNTEVNPGQAVTQLRPFACCHLYVLLTPMY